MRRRKFIRQEKIEWVQIPCVEDKKIIESIFDAALQKNEETGELLPLYVTLNKKFNDPNEQMKFLAFLKQQLTFVLSLLQENYDDFEEKKIELEIEFFEIENLSKYIIKYA